MQGHNFPFDYYELNFMINSTDLQNTKVKKEDEHEKEMDFSAAGGNNDAVTGGMRKQQ